MTLKSLYVALLSLYLKTTKWCTTDLSRPLRLPMWAASASRAWQLRSRKPWKTMESHEWHPWSILKPSQAIQRFLEAPMAFVSTWCAGKICVVKWYNPDHACLISYFRFELAEFLVGSDTCSLLPADQRLREVQCRWSGRARISESSSRDQRFWLISPDFKSHDVLFAANSVQAQLRCVFWCFRYWLVKMPSLGLTHVP